MKNLPVAAAASVIVCCVGVALYRLLSGRGPNKTPKTESVRPTMEFEFGETRESEAFFDRNPKFMPMFLSLMDLANKYLGDRPAPKNQVEEICFGLGHSCRQDYLEVIFLAANGYGGGASKITRSLYERSVTLNYLVQNPAKVERFVRFGAVQEHRMMQAALQAVNESEFDATMGSPNTVAEIRKRYREIKPEFETELCEKCGTTRVQVSWDLDIAAIVHKLGGLYQQFYLPNYALPNSSIHATLSSARVKSSVAETRREADLQVLCASFLMVLALRSQEALFHLGLDKEIEKCEQSVHTLRPQHDDI